MSHLIKRPLLTQQTVRIKELQPTVDFSCYCNENEHIIYGKRPAADIKPLLICLINYCHEVALNLKRSGCF